MLAQAGSRWRIVEFHPGGRPLGNLAVALVGNSASAPEINLTHVFLTRGPKSIIEWCKDDNLLEGQNLLLLVDQFEELFRYQDYAGREEAEAFVALLIQSAASREVPIYVTLTMRSEYLAGCALFDGLAEVMNAGQFLTPRMTREQCRIAIVEPARVCGVDIEEGLVNQLLNDVVDFAPWDDHDGGDQLNRIARRADQLPLLQHTLNRLWVRSVAARPLGPIALTLGDYWALGGLRGTIGNHANEILTGLGEKLRPTVEAVFRALTSGTSLADAVRRPTRFDDLVAICGGDREAVERVVEAFRAPGCNFLLPEIGVPLENGVFVDITHESLIRQWKQLTDWLEEEARAKQQWHRLIDAAASYFPAQKWMAERLSQNRA